ncbi:hypothetical protein ABKN59_003207 [Abortiporus biennis]
MEVLSTIPGPHFSSQTWHGCLREKSRSYTWTFCFKFFTYEAHTFGQNTRSAVSPKIIFFSEPPFLPTTCDYVSFVLILLCLYCLRLYGSLRNAGFARFFHEDISEAAVVFSARALLLFSASSLVYTAFLTFVTLLFVAWNASISSSHETRILGTVSLIVLSIGTLLFFALMVALKIMSASLTHSSLPTLPLKTFRKKLSSAASRHRVMSSILDIMATVAAIPTGFYLYLIICLPWITATYKQIPIAFVA